MFSRTRALAAFLARPSGAQAVANLWKVLETARAYEAAAPATLRAFVRFLQDEEASSQAEGDSPVGEPIGASVEIVTVHKAKGLEYPIVIVADLFTNRLPGGDCIIDHAAGRGWLKIGKFKPGGWEQQEEIENLEQDAEGRRLLYVAATRARDHLIIPCLPVKRLRAGWGLSPTGWCAMSRTFRSESAAATSRGLIRVGSPMTLRRPRHLAGLARSTDPARMAVVRAPRKTPGTMRVEALVPTPAPSRSPY